MEKATEDKLQSLAPNNHLLRVQIPVIPTSALGAKEKQIVSNDMQVCVHSEDMMSILYNFLPDPFQLNPISDMGSRNDIA